MQGPHGEPGAFFVGCGMAEEQSTYHTGRVAMQEYAEYWAWLQMASEEEKHAVTVVEELLGRIVLEQMAHNAAEEVDAWLKD